MIRIPLLALVREWRSNHRAANSLHAFADRVFYQHLEGRLPARVHRVLMDAMEDLTRQTTSTILLICIPPGSGKTTLVRILIAWLIGRFPKKSTLYVTNSEANAERSGRAVRDTILSPDFAQIFPNTKLSSSLTGAGAFATTAGGETAFVGVTSSLLGRRCHYAVCDDLITSIEEASSNTRLQKLHEVFEGGIMTRLVGGNDIGHMIVINQRLSRHDIAGYLVDRAGRTPDGRRLRALVIPMEATADDPADDPLSRVLHQPMWPEYFSPEMIADAKADPVRWQTLYQQQPLAGEGAWCDPANIQWAPRPTLGQLDDYQIRITCDFAMSTTTTADYTVLCVIGIHRRTGAVHVLDMARDRFDPAASAEKLLDLCEIYEPIEVLCDKDNFVRGHELHMRSRAAARRVRFNFVTLPMKGSKEERASGLAALILHRRLYLDTAAPWVHHIVRELAAFPLAIGHGVDDCVDSLALIGHRLPAIVVARPEAPKPVKAAGYTWNDLIEDNEGASRRPRL